MLRLALFGWPVKHSLSPQIHRLFAAQQGIAVDYALHATPPAELPAAMAAFFAHGGHGANLTLPHKQSGLALVDELSATAAAVGAINCVVRNADGRLKGENTDGAGFVADLVGRIGYRRPHARVLLIGAGGAARAVLPTLHVQRPALLCIANRTVARAAELLDDHAALDPGRRSHAIALDQLHAFGPFDLVVNASSAGHDQGAEALCPPLAPDALAYDLSYGAAARPFLAAAAAAGAQCHDGLGMLIEQAAECYALWTGFVPDTQPVHAALAGSN